MTESVKWLNSIADNFFPFIFIIFDAAFIHISKSLFAIISTINIYSSIPKNNSMISPLAWHISALQKSHIKPFLFCQIVIEKIFIKITTFLLISTKEIQFIFITYTFCPGSWQWNMAFIRQKAPLILINIVYV